MGWSYCWFLWELGSRSQALGVCCPYSATEDLCSLSKLCLLLILSPFLCEMDRAVVGVFFCYGAEPVRPFCQLTGAGSMGAYSY